jgi:hypothetical protein
VDRQARISALLGQIDLPEFYRLLNERLRGGLPGQSMGDGIRAGGNPMPAFDPVDEVLLRTKREVSVSYFLIERYRQSKNWNGVERELTKVSNLVQSVTAVHIPKPDDDAIPCSNVACVPTPEYPDRGFLTETDIRQGRGKKGPVRCARCRTWKAEHGLDFPNKLRIGELHAQEAS